MLAKSRSSKPRSAERRSRRLGWLSLCVGGLIVALVALVWRGPRMRESSRDDGNTETSATSSGPRRLPTIGSSLLAPPSIATSTPAQPQPPPIAASVPDLMMRWRLAIVNKDADTVEQLDQIFADNARTFVPALMTSAESDPEPRVRSFSTRVLGKLKPAESAPLMTKLLGDPSEYVRFNAAWALGELDSRDAMDRLRQIAKRDQAASVRQSAASALRKMSGG